jgi:hypothetical protein
MTTEPWADAANKAIGALYKHLATRPSEAEMEAARLKAEMNLANLDKTRLSNKMNQRVYDMGGWAGAPATTLEYLFGQSLNAPARNRYENIYVTKPSWQDYGDIKVLEGVNNPIRSMRVGVAPKVEYDKESNRSIGIPGVASSPVANMFGQTMLPSNRPVMGQDGRNFVAGMAQDAGVDPALADGVFGAESSYGMNQGPSSAGAVGPMQVKPDTLLDPGFGVNPAQDDSQQENVRVAMDYLSTMLNRYDGNESLALMAYNWGPYNVDAWLQDGADPNAVPAETQDYLQKVLGAGQQQQPPQQTTQMTPETSGGNVQGGIVWPDASGSYDQPQEEVNRQTRQDFARKRMNDDLDNTFASAIYQITEGGAGAMSFRKDVPLFGGQTSAGQLEIDLARISSKNAIDEIARLKNDESKTGGFFGNLSDGERQAVSDAIAPIRQDLKPESLAYILMVAQDTKNDIIAGRLDPEGTARNATELGVTDWRTRTNKMPTITDIRRAQSTEEITEMWDVFQEHPVFQKITNGEPPGFIADALEQRYLELR